MLRQRSSRVNQPSAPATTPIIWVRTFLLGYRRQSGRSVVEIQKDQTLPVRYSRSRVAAQRCIHTPPPLPCRRYRRFILYDRGLNIPTSHNHVHSGEIGCDKGIKDANCHPAGVSFRNQASGGADRKVGGHSRPA